MKKTILICLILGSLLSCEKLETEIPIKIINNSSGSYSNVFERALEKKLSRRNFDVVEYETMYTIVLTDFYVDEWYEYETVYDDCDYGTTEYELLNEQLFATVSFYKFEDNIESWNIDASQSEYLKEGDSFLVDILTSDDDCEDEGNCNCTEYRVKSPGILNINNDLRSSARNIANDLVDMLSY